MANPLDITPDGPEVASDSGDDDRVGEAVEVYLLAFEQGQPPVLDDFVARYPGIEEDIRSAIEGLELVHGLLGLGSATGSGSGRRAGLDHRIESGKRIAGYRVVRELGRGGMGTVYEAVHVGLDRPVALKVLGVHAAPDSSARRRFLNEARTAAGLHHTHIVPVFDVGQVGGLCYYAMQRIEGSGLDRVLKHLRRTRQVASGSAEAFSGSRLPAPGDSGRGAKGPALTYASPTSRLWGKLSATWRQGPRRTDASPVSGLASARQSIATVSPGELAGSNGSRPPGLPVGSTASWGSSARETRLSEPPERAVGLPAIAKTALPGLNAGAPERDRQAGEAPPFDPPRGASYFRWAAKVAFESADALAHAHQQGVIHRDVKPSNLLIDAKGSIWVTDFGLARRLADPGITHHDSLLGTPRYMSPEQARTGTIDGRTDVYSLGATLYELLTLRPPFDGQTAAELIDQIGGQDPAPPTKVDRRVPRDLETIALKALAKRPSDRYATATELFDDLGRFLNREPVRARRIGPIGRIWRVARRHPGITAVSTAAAAIILAIATFAYMKVLSERNLLIAARGKTLEALNREKQAKDKERAARTDQLHSMIELVGLSGTPNRRSKGLELISEAASLDPDPKGRADLRDSAVKFLVLRDFEAVKPDLATGRSHGLAFASSGRRLAVLSEDEGELSLWDVEGRRALPKLSLRPSQGNSAQPALEPTALDAAPVRTDSAGGGANLSSASLRAGSPGQRQGLNRWWISLRLAQIGPYIATILPEDRGLALVDLLSGSPLRVLDRPDHSIVGVLGESTGRRLVTIEQVVDDAMSQMFADGSGVADFPPFRGYQVNLWDADNLAKPIASLPWRVGPSARREAFPLVAISPDGKTVAVAAHRGMLVKLYTGRDGTPLKRRVPNRQPVKDLEIEPQAELTALALGPNNSLATAGNTPGGVAVRIWDLDSPSSQTSLNPAQSETRMMRFSPQGNLLAIIGSGPIELWDPVALNPVAVLAMSDRDDQAMDLAFVPDGRTLAAVSRAGTAKVWTIHDSAARTQLSGFDTLPTLAFSDDGVLAGVARNGEIWSWRSGRCPEFRSTASLSSGSASASMASGPPESRRLDSPGPDGQRNRSRPRGPRGGPPPSLSFDESGRMVLHDMMGLRVYNSDSVSAENPPAFWIPIASPQGFTFWRPETARTPDGKFIALARLANLYLWHAQSPGQLTQLVLPEVSAVDPAKALMRRQSQGSSEPQGRVFRSIQIAPRGDRIFTIEQIQGSPSVGRAWEIAMIAGAKTTRAREVATVSLPDGLTSSVLSRDGKTLAVADRTGQVTLLDALRLTVVGWLQPAAKEPETYLPPALAISPDGNELAVGSQQGAISLWSISNPARPRLRVHLPGHRAMVANLIYDPQVRRLASATFDSNVEVWDLEIIDRALARLRLDN